MAVSLRNAVSGGLRLIGFKIIGLSEAIRPSKIEVIEKDGNMVICRAGGNIWRLDSTQYLDGEIIKKGVFEPESTQLVHQIVKPGMVVLDVGANFGYYTVQFSKLVGAAGRVYAFEPSKHFRERLFDHLRRNNCSNVTVLDFGLSKDTVSFKLYRSDSTATLHPIVHFLRPIDEEMVQLKTLDKFVEENKMERVDFVKVDIDGHESDFVKGAEKTLIRFRPIILMEFAQLNLMEGGSSVVNLAGQMENLGYTFFSEKTGKQFPNHTSFLRQTMNCSHSVNVLCYPKEKAAGYE